MKNLKRALAAAFAACLLAVCAGCSSSGSSNAAGDAASGSSAPSASSQAFQPAELADGVYDIRIDTDSSMVNVVSGLLEVEDGAYTVSMSLNGEGFSRLYLGKASEAADAQGAEIYDYRLNGEGKYTFDFPLRALDEDVDVALFGQRRDTWYDHVLVFHAPIGDVLDEPVGTAASGVEAIADGEHAIEVSLGGGTGRASVESPAKIVIDGDVMVATIVWSSPNYDRMIVGGVQYLPENEQGNSTFEIPVAALDEDLPVSAETTAMSEPHMIDYTLRFDSSTLK